MKLDEEKRYYVYGLYDPKEKYPFYVGKGTGKRKDAHFQENVKGENPHKDRKIAKIKKEGREPRSKIIYGGLSEREAYNKEYGLIFFLEVQSGCKLTNFDYKWGVGKPSGCEFTDEARKKMSKAQQRLRGEKNQRNKLTVDQVATIKWLYENTKVTQTALAERCEVKPVTVHAITSNKNWTHVDPKKPNEELIEWAKQNGIRWDGPTKLTKEQAGEVKWLAKNSDLTHKEIGSLYEVNESLVSRIRNEKRHGEVKAKQPK